MHPFTEMARFYETISRPRLAGREPAPFRPRAPMHSSTASTHKARPPPKRPRAKKARRTGVLRAWSKSRPFSPTPLSANLQKPKGDSSAARLRARFRSARKRAAYDRLNRSGSVALEVSRRSGGRRRLARASYRLNRRHAGAYRPAYRLNRRHAGAYFSACRRNRPQAGSYRSTYRRNRRHAGACRSACRLNRRHAGAYRPACRLNRRHAGAYRPACRLNRRHAGAYFSGDEFIPVFENNRPGFTPSAPPG